MQGSIQASDIRKGRPLGEVLKQWLQELQVMKFVVYLGKQLDLEHIRVLASERLELLIAIVVRVYGPADKAHVLVVSGLLCSQVELEADRSGRPPWQVDKLPGHVVVSRRHPAAVALECNRRPLAGVLAGVGEERREGHHPKVHEPRRSHRDRRRRGQLSAGHARERGDVELDVIDERHEVGGVGRLDPVHLDVASLDGLVQQPVEDDCSSVGVSIQVSGEF